MEHYLFSWLMIHQVVRDWTSAARFLWRRERVQFSIKSGHHQNHFPEWREHQFPKHTVLRHVTSVLDTVLSLENIEVVPEISRCISYAISAIISIADKLMSLLSHMAFWWYSLTLMVLHDSDGQQVLVCRYNLKILKLALPNNVGDTSFCEYEMRSS